MLRLLHGHVLRKGRHPFAGRHVDVMDEMRLYGEMHRFLPALASEMGVRDLRYTGGVAVPEWNGCPDEVVRRVAVLVALSLLGSARAASAQLGPLEVQKVRPNLFLLNGPNGPVGNFSLIEVAELQLPRVGGLRAIGA